MSLSAFWTKTNKPEKQSKGFCFLHSHLWPKYVEYGMTGPQKEQIYKECFGLALELREDK